MSLKGISQTQEHKQNISKAKKGKKFTEQHRKNLSLSHIGYKHPQEVKEKIRQSHIGLQAGMNNPNWKGGRLKQRGYIVVHNPLHPLSDSYGYIPEHRLVMEKQLGRYLKYKEEVHHINGIRDDNRIENLMLFVNKSAHQRFEYKKEVKSNEIIFKPFDN